MCCQFCESANKYELKTVDFDHGLRKISLLILALPGTLIFMLLPLFLGAVTETFDFSDRQIGSLASADLFGFTLSAGSAVFWIRRVNWRYVMLAALLLLFAANLITILLSGFYSLTAIRFFCGFCGGTGIQYLYCLLYRYQSSTASSRNESGNSSCFGIGTYFSYYRICRRCWICRIMLCVGRRQPGVVACCDIRATPG